MRRYFRGRLPALAMLQRHRVKSSGIFSLRAAERVGGGIYVTTIDSKLMSAVCDGLLRTSSAASTEGVI